MKTLVLGASSLRVTPICLGTMTFGEQVNEPLAHQILDRSLERGVNFLDTAEMYAVPARAECPFVVNFDFDRAALSGEVQDLLTQLYAAVDRLRP